MISAPLFHLRSLKPIQNNFAEIFLRNFSYLGICHAKSKIGYLTKLSQILLLSTLSGIDKFPATDIRKSTKFTKSTKYTNNTQKYILKIQTLAENTESSQKNSRKSTSSIFAFLPQLAKQHSSAQPKNPRNSYTMTDFNKRKHFSSSLFAWQHSWAEFISIHLQGISWFCTKK